MSIGVQKQDLANPVHSSRYHMHDVPLELYGFGKLSVLTYIQVPACVHTDSPNWRQDQSLP